MFEFQIIFIKFKILYFHFTMKDMNIYTKLFIASVLFCLILSLLWTSCGEKERERFLELSRATAPVAGLERIKSPTTLAISFDEFFHMDSLIVKDQEGKRLLDIALEFYRFWEEEDNYSDFKSNRHSFHMSIDEIGIAGLMVDYSYDDHCAIYGNSVSLDSFSLALSYPGKVMTKFKDEFFDPLIAKMFGNFVYVRDSSPNSLIKAVTLNNVGSVKSIYLYNGDVVRIKRGNHRTYEECFRSSVDSIDIDALTSSYESRLGRNLFKDYSEEAYELASYHIRSIAKSLETEEFEVLQTSPVKYFFHKENRKTSYRKWIDYLPLLTFISTVCIIIFGIMALTRFVKKNRINGRLSEIRKKYSQSAGYYALPPAIDNNSFSKYYDLLWKPEEFWIESENRLLEENRRRISAEEKLSDLRKNHPDGLRIVRNRHPEIFEIDLANLEEEIIAEDINYSRCQEELRIIKEKEQEKFEKSIREDIEKAKDAAKSCDVETTSRWLTEIKVAVQDKKVDQELLDAIEKVQAEFEEHYNEGIVDPFPKTNVDYEPVLQFVQGEEWKYPMARFPETGRVVFPYRRRSVALRGYSEEKFQSFLSAYFDDSVLVLGDCSILPADNCRPYEPDIAIICKNRPSIRIDVEVDEPYSGYTREPIHYIGCGDDFRDMNLNNLGWIVVRFTEHQVYVYARRCAEFIAAILAYLDKSFKIPGNIDFSGLSEDRWTEIEAKVMACEKYRETYLNHIFCKQETESVRSCDIRQTEKERDCSESVPAIIVRDASFIYNNDENVRNRHPRDSRIQFLPFEHIYILDGKESLMSVSNLVSLFFPEFKSYYWSERKAREYGISQAELLEEWDAKGAQSREVGTFMHQQIRNYYHGLPFVNKYRFTYKGKYKHIDTEVSLESEFEQFICFLNDHKFKPFRTEWTIFDEDLKIAGTIDVIHKKNGTFDLYDWKRSHRLLDEPGDIRKTNPFQYGIHGLERIPDTVYWHYCLQLNIYRYILERNYDMTVDKMYLILLHSEAIEYRKIVVPRMDEYVGIILNAFRDGSVYRWKSAADF